MDAVKSNDRTSPETATPEMVAAAYAAYRDDEVLKRADDWLESVINAALAARSGVAQTPGLWRLIETAPKDGTEIIGLFYRKYESFEKPTIYGPWTIAWDGRKWRSSWDGQEVINYQHYLGTDYKEPDCDPTHWQPLPQGPDTSTDRHVNKMAARGPDCACCEQQPRKDCTVPGCTMKDVEWAIPAIHSGSLQCLRCGTVDAFGPVSPEKK